MTEEEARAVIAIILMTKTKLGGWWYDITPFDLLNEFSREFPQFTKLVELAEEEERKRKYKIYQEQIERLASSLNGTKMQMTCESCGAKIFLTVPKDCFQEYAGIDLICPICNTKIGVLE